MTNASPPLEKNPERIDMEDPRFDAATRNRHANRYRWARDVIRSRFVQAGRVIDFSCGTGYGSAILKEAAHEVYGRDISAEAIEIARARHGSTLVHFKAEWPTYHGAGQPLFDAVVSIETIEHMTETEVDLFISLSMKLLAPGGLLIVSTPEARADRVVENPYHLREYTRDELAAVIHNAGFADLKYDDWLPGFLCVTARRPL